MCGRTSPELEARTGPAGHRFCQQCYEREFFVCSLCGEVEFQHSRQEWIDMPGGPVLSVCSRGYRNCTTWEVGAFDVAEPSYKKIRSTRKYGLELETSDCPNYRSLRGHTMFGAKFDCSVHGMEFISPVLYGDEGLAAVEEFCAHADRLDFDVDSDCGYHLHIDMRGEDYESLKAVAYAYHKADAAWRLLVDSFRANDCGYCRRPEYRRRDLERVLDKGSMDCFCDRQDRYSLCNLNAYSKFGSFEIRLHQGSLEARAVCNWIKAHLRFVDWAKDKTFDEIDDAFRGSDVNKWESLKAIFGDIDLNRYYGRIRRGRLNESAERERADSVA
jgi:hypothetical protein